MIKSVESGIPLYQEMLRSDRGMVWLGGGQLRCCVPIVVRVRYERCSWWSGSWVSVVSEEQWQHQVTGVIANYHSSLHSLSLIGCPSINGLMTRWQHSGVLNTMTSSNLTKWLIVVEEEARGWEGITFRIKIRFAWALSNHIFLWFVVKWWS